MVCHEGREIDLTVEDLAASFKLLKRKCRLDAHGVSPRALELLFIAKPEELVSFIRSFMSSSSCMVTLSCGGLAMGKESSRPSVDKVRLILPQPCVMELIDAVLAVKLHKFLDRSFTFAPDISVSSVRGHERSRWI